MRSIELLSLTGDEGSHRPIGSLVICIQRKKVQLKNGRFLTGLRGGPILSLPFLLLTVSKYEALFLFPRKLHFNNSNG